MSKCDSEHKSAHESVTRRELATTRKHTRCNHNATTHTMQPQCNHIHTHNATTMQPQCNNKHTQCNHNASNGVDPGLRKSTNRAHNGQRSGWSWGTLFASDRCPGFGLERKTTAKRSLQKCPPKCGDVVEMPWSVVRLVIGESFCL